MQESLFTAKDAKDAKEKQKEKSIPKEKTCGRWLILARRLAVSPKLILPCLWFSFASMASFAVSVSFEFSDRD
jgi:hypothetical protein